MLQLTLYFCVVVLAGSTLVGLFFLIIQQIKSTTISTITMKNTTVVVIKVIVRALKGKLDVGSLGVGDGKGKAELKICILLAGNNQICSTYLMWEHLM